MLWELLQKYHLAFIAGLATTVHLAVVVWVVGIALGGTAGLFLGFRSGFAHATHRYISYTVSSIPAIVALFWFHYPLQQLLGLTIDPFVTSTIVLSTYNAVAVSSIVHAAMLKFPRQYIDAAIMAGLDGAATMRHIVLPILLRGIAPALLVSQVAALHTTLFASLISLNELFRTAQQINSIEYRPIPIFTALGLFYLCAGLPVFAMSEILTRRYARDLSEH